MMEKDGASITEQDVSVILQRYTPTTIIGLLQEVSQVEDVKIDWNALVKNTKTGITNAREYQMLWCRLAFCDPLLDQLEAHAQPLDDDSDLECELEAFPTVSNEASAEAAACVKVLMASGSSNESCIEKGLIIEAPLTINIPRTYSTQHPSENTQFGTSTSGVNISVPVYVPTQVLPTVASAEGLDAIGCANNNLPPRRKRKPWSAEEDRELFAAVQRFGEGNWANMLKGDFRSDRTASQLSQRWNIIKKRQRYSSMKNGSQLSEVQLTARRAFNMALDKPRVDTPKASSPGWTNRGNLLVQPTVADTPPSTTLPQRAFLRPQPFSTRPLASGLDAVKAAAVAAGARIATQSAAAAILKQQMKSAIHIKTTRVPPAPVAHMGSDYFRAPCSRLSPNTPRSSLGSSHANANIPPVGQLNQGSMGQFINGSSEVKVELEAKHSSSAHSPESIQEDKAIGLVSKDEDEQPPGFNHPPNTILKSEGQS